MSRILLNFILVLLLASGEALAGDCDADLQKIDEALNTMELSQDERAQIDSMQQQASDLCASGQSEEGEEILAEAKAMLSIE